MKILKDMRTDAYNIGDAIRLINASADKLLTKAKRRGYVCPCCNSGAGTNVHTDEHGKTKKPKYTGMDITEKGFLHCWTGGCAWNEYRPKKDANGHTEQNTGGGSVTDLYVMREMLDAGHTIAEINAYSDAEFEQFQKPFLKAAIDKCAEALQIKIDPTAPDRDDMPKLTAAKERGELQDYTKFYIKCRKDLYNNAAAQAYLTARKIELDPDELNDYQDARDDFYLGYCDNWLSPAADFSDALAGGSHVIILPVSKNYYLIRQIDGDFKGKETGNGSTSLWYPHGPTAPDSAPTFAPFSFNGKKIVYVCESAFNAMTICQLGGDAVATNSTNGWTLYADALKDYGKTDVITAVCYDPDAAGHNAAKSIYDDLKTAGYSVYVCNNLTGSDNDINDAMQADPDALTSRFTALNAAFSRFVEQGNYFIAEHKLAANLGEYGDILTIYEPAPANATSDNDETILDAAEDPAPVADPGDDLTDQQREILQRAFDALAAQDGKLEYAQFKYLNDHFDLSKYANINVFFTEHGFTSAPVDTPPTTGELFDEFLRNVSARTYEPIPTGFTALDNVIGGLTAGQLVLLLGAPGIGKTTLMQEILEKAARGGRDVIFLNLEMQRDQLFAKSISRIMAAHGVPLSNAGVLRAYDLTGDTLDAYNAAVDEYKRELLPHVSINPPIGESGYSKDIDDIQKYLMATGEAYRQANKPAPIVALDYLQYVTRERAKDPGDIVKAALAALNTYASDYHTIAFAISAVNREAMKKGRIENNSGRDTSAIEFTADVQLAVNYTVLQAGLLSGELTNAHLKYLSSQSPRRVCLQVLKARFAEPYKMTYLDYEPDRDTFKSVTPNDNYFKAIRSDAELLKDVAAIAELGTAPAKQTKQKNNAGVAAMSAAMNTDN